MSLNSHFKSLYAWIVFDNQLQSKLQRSCLTQISFSVHTVFKEGVPYKKVFDEHDIVE